MMRYLSGGESHGLCLVAIIEGLPAGLAITSEYINAHLRRRQHGYGRGERMKIESDRVEFLSGLRFNETIGSPLTLKIDNRDAANWEKTMISEGRKPRELKTMTSPRPGHADFAGGLKYLRRDFRDILERSSARETALKVAVGSVARRILEELGMNIYSHVISIGDIASNQSLSGQDDNQVRIAETEIYAGIESSPLRCADRAAEKKIMAMIDNAQEAGDTLGGVFEIIVVGVPPGLGSYAHWDRRLDARVAGALMSLQGVKGVEVGAGFQTAARRGSSVHDPFYYSDSGKVCRSTNRAGGIEGGISNGEPLIFRAALKPISTLMSPLQSIDFSTGKEAHAAIERSDICAVPAASVVGEAIVAWEMASILLDTFSRDTVKELQASYRAYLDMIAQYPKDI
ncbi:MAG: chorismate synthase [Dethiobacteria bacterium]